MPRSLTLAGVCLAMLLAGCQAPQAQTTPVHRYAHTDISSRTECATVFGRVEVPPGVIETGNGNVTPGGIGNVISTGGGNVISTGGGNIIATGGGNYRLQAIDKRPLIGAEVVVCDAAGFPLSGVSPTKTNLFGQFTLLNVPRGGTYVLRVGITTLGGKPAMLQTLVKPVAATATADITMGTTVLTTALLSVHGKEVEQVTADAFHEAVRVTEGNLKQNRLPDLSDHAAILKKAREFSAAHIRFKALLVARKNVAVEVQAEPRPSRDQAKDEEP